MSDRTLFRDGLVLTMTDGEGARVADVLVEDGRVAAIGQRLDVDARVIDARGCIVMPGLVDTHRHVWLTLLRGLAADWSFRQMIRVVRYQAPRFYRPEDMFVGNHLGMTEALNAGVTTVLDFSHCIKSAAHAEALVEGSRRSGVRSIFGMGLMEVHGLDDDEPGLLRGFQARANHLRSVAQDWSHDGRLSLGVALSRWLFDEAEPARTANEIAMARELGLRITAHIQTVPVDPDVGSDIGRLRDAGLMGSDMTLAHLVFASDEDIATVVAAGAGVACCPTATQIGSGSMPPIARILEAGGHFGLGADLVPRGSGGILNEVRSGLLGQRQMNRFVAPQGVTPTAGDFPSEVLVHAATRGGAEALGMADQIGTLEVGKLADIIMVRGDTVRTFPVLNPYRTLAFHAETGDVDTVMVGGVLRKVGGQLLGDQAALMHEAQRSHDYLMQCWEEAGGLDPDAGIDVGF